MWVKICANTNLADALLAAELGADAVGFVFAESSKRRVFADQVAAITRDLPEYTETYGVFDRLEFGYIVDTVRAAGLTGVQLHGAFNPELVSALKDEFGLRIDLVQTLHWTVGGGADEAGSFEESVRQIRKQGLVSRILVDAKTSKASGGTGQTFDWSVAKPSIEQAKRTASVIVAGGLNPENVGDAIAVLKPWGVDVASGVEAEPGRKDRSKLAAFIQNAKG